MLILLHWWNNKKNNNKKIGFKNPLPPPPVKKILNLDRRKKNLNKNYWKFDFSIGSVLVIFSFFWTDNDLACAPPPLGGMSPFFQSHNYSRTFAHNSKTTNSIFVKFWEIAIDNMTVTNLK